MKKLLLTASIILVLAAAACGIWYYFATTNEVKINSSNVASGTVYDINQKDVAHLTKSGQTVRLSKHGDYHITYVATEGYASGTQQFNADTSTVTISPYYSDQKLSSALQNESSTIHTALTTAYPQIASLYDVTSEHLYHSGDWYGALLKYKGSDIFNLDNLRVVLHKENNTWVVTTTPPLPTLSTYTYPSIPIDILQAVNKY